MRELEKIIDETKQGEAIIEDGTLLNPKGHIYIESYGCAMNFSDSEIVASILKESNYAATSDLQKADVIFVNTCSIRENAESKVRNRLNDFKKLRKKKPELLIGVLGCMAERLKSKLLDEENLVDMVVGPDAYRSLPQLIELAEDGQRSVNVLLSREETYADINPVRLGSNGINAFISIMRGCDNMCSFCVVPFTRGRERSRDPESIVREAKLLVEQGYKEVTLLGQNVDSYFWAGNEVTKENIGPGIKATNFSDLLEMVALVSPELRVRFSTSHPKDMTDEVLMTMAKYENICDYVHLPVQSGNSRILNIMNRGYTREWYMDRIRAIRSIIPGCGISSDIISGFCSETEEEHDETKSIMEWAEFDFSYMFKYSERPGTLAERKFTDDVPEETKGRRLQEIVDLQQKLSYQSNLKDIGKTFKVLAESLSKRSDEHLSGRTAQNKVVIFPRKDYKPGDYVHVQITSCTPATLLGISIN
jgi:tRNA-2-methylthio-N6-dimethylallyladenosine synthase